MLLAVAEPGRDEVLRAALGTELLDVSGEQLVALLDDDRAWAGRLEAFHRYHQRVARARLRAHVPRAARDARACRPRLLEYADGERRLTNLLHLGELLQDEAARHPRGLDALVQWMAERAADEQPESEEQQLRLESDEHVVKIVTVHKSKGLEYPVVFCPFVWDGRLFAVDAQRERDVVCHDPAGDDRATLELEADARAARCAPRPVARSWRSSCGSSTSRSRAPSTAAPSCGAPRAIRTPPRRSGCCTPRRTADTVPALHGGARHA